MNEYILYWIDTKWGCGGIYAKNNIVIKGASIFKKFIGISIIKLALIYDVRKVNK